LRVNGDDWRIVAQAGAFKRGSEEATIYQSLAPEDQDIVVRKVRVSAFSGSDLEILLRALDIDTLILPGISTGGVVLSTVCEAADKTFASSSSLTVALIQTPKSTLC
jgi:nicotinamidase-related amidase